MKNGSRFYGNHKRSGAGEIYEKRSMGVLSRWALKLTGLYKTSNSVQPDTFERKLRATDLKIAQIWIYGVQDKITSCGESENVERDIIKLWKLYVFRLEVQTNTMNGIALSLY